MLMLMLMQCQLRLMHCQLQLRAVEEQGVHYQ